MLNRLILAAAVVAFAYAASPANAAKVSAGCSGDNLSKTETMIENMADGEGKMMAQKEIAAAQDSLLYCVSIQIQGPVASPNGPFFF